MDFSKFGPTGPNIKIRPYSLKKCKISLSNFFLLVIYWGYGIFKMVSLFQKVEIDLFPQFAILGTMFHRPSIVKIYSYSSYQLGCFKILENTDMKVDNICFKKGIWIKYYSK